MSAQGLVRSYIPLEEGFDMTTPEDFPLPEPDGYAVLTPTGTIIVSPADFARHNAYAVFTAEQLRATLRAWVASRPAAEAPNTGTAQPAAPDVDELARAIRIFGAGALAERLVEWMQSRVPTAAPVGSAAVRDVLSDYEHNILEGVASWLHSRSGTVWARQGGYTGLMQSWATDLRGLRLRALAPHPDASAQPANADLVDAERYRWLRDHWLEVRACPSQFGGTLGVRILCEDDDAIGDGAERLDAAIDTARASKGQTA
jgi:hypothetical protein